MPIFWIIRHSINKRRMTNDESLWESCDHCLDSPRRLRFGKVQISLQRSAHFLKDVGRPMRLIQSFRGNSQQKIREYRWHEDACVKHDDRPGQTPGSFSRQRSTERLGTLQAGYSL